MPLPKVARIVPAAVAVVALAAGAGEGAVVEVGNLVLRADGGFTPQTLPRHRFAPIDFQGHVDISARGGGKPAALQQALIDFDRDGRINVAGLPTCNPEAIAAASPADARRTCRGAIVGSGHVEALVSLAGGTVRARSPLTIFNGPRLPTGPSAVLHARFTVPATQTYAILVPIEKRSGGYRYRARLELPPLAGGLGALTHIDVKIGRRYRAGGRERSYVSARCSDNVLRTHGRFEFEGGIVISGLVEKFCQDK
ncbi:MAG: hypothetical protein ACTHKT_03105 [Solirubrobacterales bacterium]